MSSKVYERILQIGLGAVMIFAPLARGARYMWSIALIQLVVLTLVFIWLCRMNNQAQKLRRTKIDLPLWLFVIVAAVSCAVSIYKYASITAFSVLLMYLGVFYLVVNNFNRYLTRRLVNLIIIVGGAMSLLGLGQYFLGLEHSWWIPQQFLSATYVNHNHFAGYLEMAIPLAIGLLLARNNRIVPRIGLAFALIIMLFAFIFAQSRGAWISLTIALIVMNVVLIKRKVLKKTSLVVFLVLIALSVAYIYAGSDNVAERLRTVEQINNQGFLEGRKLIWQGTLNMIKANPLTGTGIGTFVWGFPPYRPRNLQVRAHYAHNDYLHLAAEMGILAFLLVLWMIYNVIAAGLKKYPAFEFPQAILLGAGIGILSLALHGLVDFNFHLPANMLVVACLAGIIMRRDRNDA